MYGARAFMKAWQKRIISRSDLPLGLKSLPPLAPPSISPVSAFLKACSNPKNFRADKLIPLSNLSPPLYGPRAELNCTLIPWFISISPSSFSHTTRNFMIFSGSTIRSNIRCFSYLLSLSSSKDIEPKTSAAAWMNSG